MKIKISLHFLSNIPCRRICLLGYKVIEAIRVSLLFHFGDISANPGARGRVRPLKGLEAGTRCLWGTRFLSPVLEAKWFASMSNFSASALCSAVAERFALLCSDYVGYYPLVLSHCPRKTIWLDEFEPVIHHKLFLCRQVCGILWCTPSQHGCGNGEERVWVDLLRRRLWE